MMSEFLISNLTEGTYVIEGETSPTENLMEEILKVRLLNTSIRLYEGSNISLETVEPSSIKPIVKYALKPNIIHLRIFREYCLIHHEVDTLGLEGIFELRDQNGNSMRIAPPIVEMLPEGVLGIIDGIHRFELAKQLGIPINVVVISGVNPEYPPISYPVDWKEVALVDERPTEPDKVRHLRVSNQRAILEKYYRDFSALGSGGRRSMVTKEQ